MASFSGEASGPGAAISALSEPQNGLRWRLENLTERIVTIERKTENVNVHDREIANLWNESEVAQRQR